jgi:hypothetical protein
MHGLVMHGVVMDGTLGQQTSEAAASSRISGRSEAIAASRRRIRLSGPVAND